GKLVPAEVQQLAREGLIQHRVSRGDLRPGAVRALAVPHAQQPRLDGGVRAVHRAVPVQIAVGAAVPDLQLGRIAELQSRRLERHADVHRVDGYRDEYRVARREVTLIGHVRRVNDDEPQE